MAVSVNQDSMSNEEASTYYRVFFQGITQKLNEGKESTKVYTDIQAVRCKEFYATEIQAEVD